MLARQTAQQQRFETWDQQPAEEALRAFVIHALEQPARLARSGCPTLSLVHDLEREGSAAAAASRLLLAEEQAFVKRSVARALGEEVETPERVDRISEWLGTSLAGIKAHAHGMGDAKLVNRQRDLLLPMLIARLR